MSQTQSPRRVQGKPAGRGRGPQLAAGVVVAVALVGVVLLAVRAGDDEGGSDAAGPVAEFMHVHGVEVPAWADFHAMAVHADGEVVYGWTSAGQTGLHRSDDGGRSWARVPAGRLEQLGGALTLAVHPEDADRLVAGTETALLASHDGGRPWQPLDFGLEEDAVGHIAVDPADTDVVYLGRFAQDLYRTRDGGDSWRQLADKGTVASESRE